MWTGPAVYAPYSAQGVDARVCNRGVRVRRQDTDTRAGGGLSNLFHRNAPLSLQLVHRGINLAHAVFTEGANHFIVVYLFLCPYAATRSVRRRYV